MKTLEELTKGYLVENDAWESSHKSLYTLGDWKYLIEQKHKSLAGEDIGGNSEHKMRIESFNTSLEEYMEQRKKWFYEFECTRLEHQVAALWDYIQKHE